jgi:hypothetical protein
LVTWIDGIADDVVAVVVEKDWFDMIACGVKMVVVPRIIYLSIQATLLCALNGKYLLVWIHFEYFRGIREERIKKKCKKKNERNEEKEYKMAWKYKIYQ